MANFHSSVEIVSRGKGHSLAQRAAYICGKNIFDEYCGQMRHCYRKDVAYCNVILPNEAPMEYTNVQTLVTEIDRSEKRRDAQTARELIFALPIELSADEQIDFACKCIKEFWVIRGMCAIIALHDKGDGNPHIHTLLTTRTVNGKGFSSKKERSWNQRELYQQWRKFYADAQNLEFKQRGLEIRVSDESYFVQGVKKTPTQYLGPIAMAFAKKGILTDRAVENLANREMQHQREQEREAIKMRRRHRSLRRF